MLRNLTIDGDHILFMVLMSKTYKDGLESLDEDGFIGDETIDQYQTHFKAIIKDYQLTAEVIGLMYGFKIGKTRVVMSDKTNFRYKLYPQYKAKRLSSDETMTKLKKWARKTYEFEKDLEADDIVSYYVRNGDLGMTTDKDLLKGVEGIWYDAHYQHKKIIWTSKAEADLFYKCQVLAGDGVDGIPSIRGVGIATAMKLLKDDNSWKNIKAIFKKHGHDKDYMLTMARLVNMHQWSPQKGLQLVKH